MKFNLYIFFVIGMMACSCDNEEPAIVQQRVIEIKDNFRQTEEFKYLADGKLLNRRLSGEFGEWIHQYAYGIDGYLTSITQPLMEGGSQIFSFDYFNRDSAAGTFISEFDQFDFQFLFKDQIITSYLEFWPKGSLRFEVKVTRNAIEEVEQVRLKFFNEDGSLGFFENYKIIELAEHKPAEMSMLQFYTPYLPGHYYSNNAFTEVIVSSSFGSPQNITFSHTLDDTGNVIYERMVYEDYQIDSWRKYTYE